MRYKDRKMATPIPVKNRGIFVGPRGRKYARDIFAVARESHALGMAFPRYHRMFESTRQFKPTLPSASWDTWYYMNVMLSSPLKFAKHVCWWPTALVIHNAAFMAFATRLETGELVSFLVPGALQGVEGAGREDLYDPDFARYALGLLTPARTALSTLPKTESLVTVFRDIPAKYAFVLAQPDVSLLTLMLGGLEPNKATLMD